jgi:signal peptidase I
MSPTYKPGALVIDKPAKDGYRPGQVITFRHSAQTTDVVTHRITDITSTGLIHTKGDGNGTADVWDIRPDQVRGTVIGGIPFAGFVVVYLQQPAGVASVMLALIALIMLWGLWFPHPSTAFMTAAEKRPTVAGVMAWDVETSPLGRLADWRHRRSGRTDGTRPAAANRTAATAAAKVAIAGMVVINVAGALTVIADQSAAPAVAPVAAGK